MAQGGRAGARRARGARLREERAVRTERRAAAVSAVEQTVAVGSSQPAGDRDEVDEFAMRFGVSVSRAINDARDITHNLRTAIIRADGTLAKVYTGNDWSPDQVIADLKTLGAKP